MEVVLTGSGLALLWRLVRNRSGRRHPRQLRKHRQGPAARPTHDNRRSSDVKNKKDIRLQQALAPDEAALVAQTQRSCEDLGDDVDRPEVEKKASSWRHESRKWVFITAAATAATAAAAVAGAATAAASRASSTKTAHKHDERNTNAKTTKKKIVQQAESAARAFRADDRVRIDIHCSRGGVVAFDASVTVPRVVDVDADAGVRVANAWSTVRRASLGQLRPKVDLRDIMWQKVNHIRHDHTFNSSTSGSDDQTNDVGETARRITGTDDVDASAVIEQESRWRWGWVRGSSRMTVLAGTSTKYVTTTVKPILIM